MKKLIIAALIMLLILPSVLAINITLEKKQAKEVVIKNLDEPAVFTFDITNNEKDDEFLFFNLFGFTMEPKDKVSIDKDETKEVDIVIYPRQDLEIKNYYTLPIYIRAKDSTEIQKKLTLKIVELQDVFEVGSDEIDPESNSLSVYIHNKENIDLSDLDVTFKSKFFEFEEDFDLDARERKSFDVELNKEDFAELTAGFYTLTAEITADEQEAEVEGIIKFSEKEIVEETKKEYGLVVSTKIIQKTNTGNTIKTTQTVVPKNIISRLFTSFSPEPDSVERNGFNVNYIWNKEIKPGETLEIKVQTNWLFPLIIIVLIGVVIILVRQFTKTDVILRKRVSFVKAKGGEFALKVTLHIFSKKYVERVNIIDRLPSLMKVYDRFGGERPFRVNEKNRLIEWSFDKLEEGESRTLSYIIYSKDVGVMGKFALPSATAIFQKDGEIRESESNRAFFIAEPKKDIDFE
jgi:hypothetical protein